MNIIKKIGFVLPSVILTITTWIWLFYKDGRYYHYRNEPLFFPLVCLHLVIPIFYFVSMIVSIVRQINQETRSSSNLFYLIASILLWLFGIVGILSFMIITSGM